MSINVLPIKRTLGGVALAGSLLLARSASADVTIFEKDRWTVFTNGRIQAFMNYNNGDGYPIAIDGNGNDVTLWGGGLERLDAAPADPPSEQGHVEELRIRSGFTGNVLGFGVKRQFNAQEYFQAYFALVATIQPPSRRKYTKIYPDAQQGHVKLGGPWGAINAGRMLTLFGRGNTEITFLYGYNYGLGWPGSISEFGEPFPTAGHVGFGVLGNGFGAGFNYETPSLGGFVATVGIYDANNYPGTAWERVAWPRPEAEFAFENKIGTTGMFKLFVNAAYQKVYEKDSDKSATAVGAGYGGRIEVGPVHLGLAGHYGKGIGLNYAFDPTPTISDRTDRTKNLRTFDGYYAQLQIALGKLDLQAGFGMTRVHLLPTDTTDMIDNDGDQTTPADEGAPAADDDGVPGPDSVQFVPIKQQVGMSAGVVYHVSKNLHLDLDYFNASYQWYTMTPTCDEATNAALQAVDPTDPALGCEPTTGAPEQNFHVLNAGITYDW